MSECTYLCMSRCRFQNYLRNSRFFTRTRPYPLQKLISYHPKLGPIPSLRNESSQLEFSHHSGWTYFATALVYRHKELCQVTHLMLFSYAAETWLCRQFDYTHEDYKYVSLTRTSQWSILSLDVHPDPFHLELRTEEPGDTALVPFIFELDCSHTNRLIYCTILFAGVGAEYFSGFTFSIGAYIDNNQPRYDVVICTFFTKQNTQLLILQLSSYR